MDEDKYPYTVVDPPWSCLLAPDSNLLAFIVGVVAALFVVPAALYILGKFATRTKSDVN